ncbi:condensation domain-containing protein, partial [Streptomyces olivaceoviridis]|uniref:condensation domain-containing protein n=1 Tax=Streptomyces olivaceoviridis TaxID=1921 RepID=UPI00369D0F8A
MNSSSLESRLLGRIRERNGRGGIPARDRSVDAPLSFAQQRLWFLDQLTPGSAEYVIPFGFRVHGGLDTDALQAALTQLVERHEVLRTRFVIREDGDPVQVVDDAQPFQVTVRDLREPSEIDDRRRDSDGQRPEAENTERHQAEQAQSLLNEEAGRPFDLTSGELLRAFVIRLADDEALLLISVHHIVADGWSMEVLTRELSALYAAALTKTPADLPEPALQYADFAIWQRQWLTGDVLERQLGYWRERLAGLEPLELPTDRPRPPVRSGQG